MDTTIIDACRELLATASPDDYYDYDDETMAVLHKLAIDILAKTNRRNIGVMVKWHEGCHCHGSDHRDFITGDTIEDIARELANHKHSDENDLGNVVWTVRLTEDEQEALRSCYNAWVAHINQLVALQKTVKNLEDQVRKQTASIDYAQTNLEALRSDLTPEAYASRKAIIDKEITDRTATETRLVTARADMAKHEGSTP